MLEVMQFIFSSVWVYLGTLLLVIVISTGINGIGKNGDELISLFEINAIIEEKDNN